ncbi:MAG: right-handed parallel beta-helix repeat-containing protein [Gammaproteobacteria bacterium]|nr:right-handed parallel beta-helix repeat-containing protein [Gammaproteobacteria bacterium]
MTNLSIPDRNAGFAAAQEQVWGFDKRTGIDSRNYFAPGAKIFYVDPNNTLATDAGNLGADPTVPLATVAAAIELCRDHQGDTIVLGASDAWQYAPRLYRPTEIVESVTIPPSRGGIRIVGASTNPFGVCWSPADDGEAAITVHAIDVLIEGIAFYPVGVTNTIGIVSEWNLLTNLYGENLTVRRCFFESGLDYGIQLDFSWYCQVYDCWFDAVAVSAIHNLNALGDPDYISICNNTFQICPIAIGLGDTDNAIIANNRLMYCATGISINGGNECIVQNNVIHTSIDNGVVAIDGESSDDCVIHGNVITGDPTGTRNFIDLTGGADNMVSDNWLSCNIVQYDTTCTGGAGDAWVNNHCTNGDTAAPPT